jgi:hypothetical protein
VRLLGNSVTEPVFGADEQVDPATVDCVVLTNFHNMQALPYFARRALGFDPLHPFAMLRSRVRSAASV